MNTVFALCFISGCPRDTAGYCPRCNPNPAITNYYTYDKGVQDGLKKAAKIAMKTVMEKPISYAVLKGAKAIEHAILEEMK